MEQILKAVIIEDEAKASRILKSLLTTEIEGIEVVAEAGDVPNGVKAISSFKPDIVFLDIELPGFSGFELADFFEEIKFEIIFTTAYSEYAIKAFEMSALDYLLKPIQIDQLKKAVSKAREKKGAQMNEKLSNLSANLKGSAQKLALPIAEGFLFVSVDEIIYLEADNTYTTIYLTNGTHVVVCKPLKEFIELINSTYFFKPHRTYYVNTNHVRQFNRQDNGSLLLSNGVTIYLARDRKQDFLDLMKSRGSIV